MTASSDKTLIDLRWDNKRLKDWDAYRWQVGHTSVWVQRLGNDWLVASDGETEDFSKYYFEKALSIPLDAEWKRWAGLDPASTVRFRPAFPDRSLVVKTRSAVMVPAGKSIELFINIPVWVEVSVETPGEPSVLGVFSTRTLSNTWFGNQFEGELCYALKSLATRSNHDLPAEALAATCRFSIENRSEESLLLDRIRILPRHLHIYKSRRRLWTSIVKVAAHGPTEPSDLEYPDETSSDSRSSVLLREREVPYRSRHFRESLTHYTRALFE